VNDKMDKSKGAQFNWTPFSWRSP